MWVIKLEITSAVVRRARGSRGIRGYHGSGEAHTIAQSEPPCSFLTTPPGPPLMQGLPAYCTVSRAARREMTVANLPQPIETAQTNLIWFQECCRNTNRMNVIGWRCPQDQLLGASNAACCMGVGGYARVSPSTNPCSTSSAGCGVPNLLEYPRP